MKALCSERFQDWKAKFERFGLKCKEVTGDSELDDYYELQSTGVIMTTPVSSIVFRSKGDTSSPRSRDTIIGYVNEVLDIHDNLIYAVC